MSTPSTVPDFESAEFSDSTQIDNPNFPLRPGTTYVYEDKQEGLVDTFEVTRETKVVDGINVVVVHDTAIVDGEKVEFTEDWFAQDTRGNVWYMGEDATQFYPDDPTKEPTHDGSWEAGQPVEGTDPPELAQPGFVMEADPKVGDTYNQEFAPGVAEDMGTVLSLDADADVRYGRFEDDVLKTKDFSAIEPTLLENKFYAPGVGQLLTTDNEGAFEQLVKILVEGTAANDRLEGYAGGDVVKGFGGDDALYGLDGDDVLGGGSGNNSLTGGKGGDAFVLFASSHSNDADNGGNGGVKQIDVIYDYNKVEGDKVYLDHGSDSIADIAESNGALQLTLEGGDHVIRLPGVRNIGDIDFGTVNEPIETQNAAADDWLLT